MNCADISVIPSAAYDRIMDEYVEPLLESSRTASGFFEGSGGASLYYEAYRAPSAKRSVIILHGYTEGVVKYREFVKYLLDNGSDVYLYDQRGHGRSTRDVPDKTLTHVERFTDYVDDLSAFVEKIVPKDMPVFLFAHSMGGAVASLYLERRPGTVAGAVLSSPMISPSTGSWPAWVGRLICRAAILFGGAKKRIFLSHEYPGEEKFEDACSSGKARFSRYELFKRSNPDYQNYSPTYRWTLESMLVPGKMLKAGEPEKIDVPMLVFTAGKDTVVSTDAIRAFAARVPSAEVVDFPESKHELCYSTDADVARLAGLTVGFFESRTVTER
ncbi:MAG: alpha/beta hydrolase [Clostridia bacterium]|nr:alpha/beta hydrolase [Clostridia bacterium]